MADVRPAETDPDTTRIIGQKHGSGGTVLIAFALLLAVIVGSWFLYATAGATSSKTGAVASQSGGAAAGKAGAAAGHASGR